MNKILTVFFVIFFSVNLAKSQISTVTNEDLQKTNVEIVKLFQQQKFDEALPLAKKAVEIAQQVHGNDNLETAKALRNLGLVELYKNDQSSAEATLEKALSIYEKLSNLSPNDSLAFAELLESLGVIKYKNQKGNAESLFEKALEWFEKTSGKDSMRNAKSLYVLGNIHFWKRNYKKSAQYYQRLFEIVIKNPKNKDVDLQFVYFRTECVYRKADLKFDVIESDYENYTKSLAEANSDKVFKSGVVNGKAISLITPAYPAEARQVRARGEIRVKVLISKIGTVISACGENEGHPALIEASENAAYRSKFQPTLLEGTAVNVSGTIIYKFIP